MSHYRRIDVRIWNDAKFNSLTPMGKLAFFMLLTHPLMTMFGAMRGNPNGLANEIGMDPERFREGLQELLAKGMAEQDDGGMIALPNFLKYNPPANPNTVVSWAKQAEYLPECELRNVVFQRVNRFVEGLGEGFAKGLREPFLEPKNIEHRAESYYPPIQGGEFSELGTTGGGVSRPALAVVNGGMVTGEDEL